MAAVASGEWCFFVFCSIILTPRPFQFNKNSNTCYSRKDQLCDTITIRDATSGAAAQTFISCIATTDLFSQPNTLYRETFALTTPTTATATVTATVISTEREMATATQTQGNVGDEEGGAGGVGCGRSGMVLAAVLVGAIGALAG